MSEVATQTLHIVARELNTELNDARAALENFGEQQDDVHFLENCRDRLHLVHGALRVSEVYGAALLAEEMEQVSRYLIGNFAEKRHLAEGLDALMRAMVQLPTYLERVLGGGRDMALILLPLLNDLRAVRGNALLSEGTLLLLNLTSEKQANPLPPAPGEHVLPVANWARKLRSRFQLGLLGWIKGERAEQNLDVLERAAEKLEQVATKQAVFQLWWVIGAVIEALRDGGLEGSASIKRLLGQADREMRRLYEQGEDQYASRPPVELLNNLLYYLARATTSGPRVAAVRTSFRLAELLPVDAQVEQARESLAAPSIKLMKTVANAIKEDLARVKDAFDLFVRKSGTQASELAPQLELLRKIGDTLGVLGLGALRDKVQQEILDLNRLVERKTPLTESALMRMASTLINIEDGLDEQLVGLIVPTDKPEGDAPAPRDDIEFRQVTEAVLRECIVNMARMKEAIALSVERPKEAQILEQVPPLVRGITAGMLMLGKTRAVELTEAIGKALFRYVRPDGVPVSQAAMDRLADAIVAVEYYMETLHAGRNDPWYMLDNAEACLKALMESDEGVTGLHSLRDLSDHAATMAAEPLSGAPTVVIDRDRTPEPTAILTRGQQATQVIPSQQAAKQAAQVAVQSRDSRVPRPPVLAPPADKSDPEFVELFIEEAREEIAKLQHAFPMWDDNPQDIDSLTNMRRSFHTLKGSGRMVGAQLIGEFAWAIETMLNRVINKTLERTPDMLVLMRRAVAAVPELVEQLESGRAPDSDVYGLIAEANAIATVRDTMLRKPQVDADDAPVAPRAAPPPAQRQPAPAPAPVVASKPTVSPVMKPRPAPPPSVDAMDEVLQEIFSKETAGHLAAIREYVASCALLTAPFPVTDTLHRACHTLSGTAKTAGARQGTKIAEPLNHYIRKLYDNGVGLPAAGMQVLRDSVRAIENVVEHINESTGYFLTHSSIIERIGKLEQALDTELTQMAQAVEASAIMPLPELRVSAPTVSVEATQSLGKMHDNASEDVIELSFDASAEDHELGLDSPTRFSRALGHSGETIEVSIDSALMEEAVRNGPLGQSYSGQSQASQARSGQTGRFAQAHEHGLAQSVANPPTFERTQRIDPPAPPTKPVPLIDRLAQATADATTRNIALPASMRSALTSSSNGATSVRLPALSPAAKAPPIDEFEVSRFDLGNLDVVETNMDMNPPEPDLVVETAAWAATYEPPSLPTESAPIELKADKQIADKIELAAKTVAPVPTITAHPPQSIAASAPGVVDEEDDQGAEDFDADVAAIFTEEAAELLDVADSSLAMWSKDRGNNALAFELKRALHTIKGGARMAGIRAMGDLSHDLESLMEAVESGRVKAEQSVLDLLQASLDELHRMRDTVSQGQRVPSAKSLLARIRAAMGLAPAVVAAAPAPVEAAAPIPQTPRPAPVQSAPTQVVPTLEVPAVSLRGYSATDVLADSATETVAVLDEDSASAELEAEFHVDELTSGLVQINKRHDETIDVPLDGEQFAAIAKAFDEEQVKPDARVETYEPVSAQVVQLHAAPSKVDADSDADVEIDDVDAAPGVAAPIALPGRDNVQAERGEVARVDAELLDMLLNNAGEVSILRSRLEQQTNSIDFNLAELGRTVTRLKEQLRKLELETEAQILHRHQDEGSNRSDFDPLELDRYSTLQQLSRALAESVSDVASIESLLGSQTREAQNLLLQQSRVVTEVQNGLMRTRMVPFQRHVQRLSRIVRQVASETHKRADLVVSGASGELDRQVLERMLPPLEHMLRNSVVHGIESPDVRQASGKPETGTIRISLHREGSEMVIHVEDDGRGIDVKAVRERAKERGLLKAGRTLTDEEALQLVLEPGFSTAASVTQHAGRGVGMDVVVAEIKKLGGALFTKSTPGQGVKFTIHLPFTLAISQALIVRIGDEMYALPLPTVEGVARVPRAEVAALLSKPDTAYTYGNQAYHLQHLGAFIDAPASTLPEADVPVPIILVNAGEHSTGLVVDELVGNREIVVKPVGPQISGIRGVAGATILGDGRIVVILDMGALVRSGWRAHTGVAAPIEDNRTFALVVDDSITVRRVTQRLLERNGMRVATAKDGVDALAVLQEQIPDIILLDIEMPRMDGYELAAQVRNDPRLAEIPIIMITSRVGEKHRARAIELGVNDYLGKPYQENQLLDSIEPLVEARRRRAAAAARG